jgi:hypothetical protein
MPADAITQRYLKERETIVSRIEGVKATSIEQKRELSEQDRQALADWQGRIKELDGLIDLVSFDVEMNHEVAGRIAAVASDMDNAPVTYRSAGELLWDVLHMGEHEPRRRYEKFSSRAAQHMGTTAAATVPTAGGLGGLVVSQVYGPIIDVVPAGRPFLTVLGVTPAPSSLAFMRPRIVDPNIDTGVGPQGLEKSELASKKFDIATDPLTLQTVGGYLNVSQQLISLVASSLDIIVGQLNKRLARATEKAAVTELQKSTAKVTLAAGADAATVLKAIYDASALVYANTGELATWLAMGPQGWARLGGLSDLAGRPMFPYLGATNANGSARATDFNLVGPAGLQTVVTPAITDATFWVGNSTALEAYEYRYPLLEAIEPSLLGRQVAVASSMVFYRPTTKEAGAGNVPPAEQNGAVHIAP